MPIVPDRRTKLQQLAWLIVCVMLGDDASSNGRLKRFMIFRRLGNIVHCMLLCECHRVHHCAGDQLVKIQIPVDVQVAQPAQPLPGGAAEAAAAAADDAGKGRGKGKGGGRRGRGKGK